MPVVRPVALLLLWTLAPAAAGAQEDDGAPLAVTVVVDGEDAGRVRDALRTPPEGLPIEITLGALPQGAEPVPAPTHDEPLAAARAAWVGAEFDRCLALLDDDAPIHEALASGRRAIAARLLFWRVACLVGVGDPTSAAQARRFATFGLDVPPDVGAVSPEVERALGAALEAVAQAPRHAVEIRSEPRAAVAIDGRPPRCETPCTVDLSPGDHVIALGAPGRVPAWNLVRAGEAEALELTLDEAPPELAARQWAERWIGRAGRESPAAVRLLAQAVRARRLALLIVDAHEPRLTGVLAIDGDVAARAEHRAGEALDEAARALLRDLLVEGGAVEAAPPVYESPWFWVGIAAGVLIAVTVPTAVVLTQDTTTRVGF